MSIQPRLLTYKEVAAYLNISLRGTKDLAATGELPKVKIGHRVLFDQVDVDEFIERKKRES